MEYIVRSANVRQFFQRRYAYLLIEYRQLDKAEDFLNIMIERNMDVEFAKGVYTRYVMKKLIINKTTQSKEIIEDIRGT